MSQSHFDSEPKFEAALIAKLSLRTIATVIISATIH